MRKLVTTLATAGVLGLGAMSAASAAPVAGYEALYTAVYANCTLPNGTLPLCEAAINAYSGALVAAVDLSVANASFTELRLEVFEGNAADEAFQADVDALFELLLPDSGSIGGGAPILPGGEPVVLGTSTSSPGTPS